MVTYIFRVKKVTKDKLSQKALIHVFRDFSNFTVVTVAKSSKFSLFM